MLLQPIRLLNLTDERTTWRHHYAAPTTSYSPSRPLSTPAFADLLRHSLLQPTRLSDAPFLPAQVNLEAITSIPMRRGSR